MEEQTNEALWYVVHTYSGYENKVANDLQTMVENRHLQDLICDIKVPTEMVPEIKDGKERMVEHKLFPGYVLVKMVMNDDTCILPIRYLLKPSIRFHSYADANAIVGYPISHKHSAGQYRIPFPPAVSSEVPLARQSCGQRVHPVPLSVLLRCIFNFGLICRRTF